jgi:hypothetical protein
LDSQWILETALEMPEPVYEHCAVYIDGNIVVIGGYYQGYEKSVLALDYREFQVCSVS